MNYLFYNWKFVHFDHFHQFCALQPHPHPSTSGNHQSVLCIYGFGFTFFNILFLDSTYKWDYVFVFD